MKRYVPSLLISGFLIAVALPGQWVWSGNIHRAARESIVEDWEKPALVEFTIYSNDSLGEIHMNYPEKTDTAGIAHFNFEVIPNQVQCLQTILDSLMYLERWDTLAQAVFWRKIMHMGRDSVVVSVAQSRQIVDVLGTMQWETKSDSLKESYRDSVRAEYALSDSSAIYVTAGKNHYYKFDKVLPSIGEAIDIFTEQQVDPWYAQAILLIESPGQLQFSPVGAYGSFQLMENVALEFGLTVNDSIDEREDFPKAAVAAAQLIDTRCVPQTRYMLRKRNITFKESDLWFRFLVLHSYHAGAGNVEGVLSLIEPEEGGMELIKRVWQTEYKGFKNASQNYSQIALASLLELDKIMESLPDTLCKESPIVML